MKQTLTQKLRMVAIAGLAGLSSLASAEPVYSKLSSEEVIKEVQTYEQASEYLKGLQGEIPNTTGINEAPFSQIHNEQRGVCRDATTAAMALLSDNTNRYAVIPLSFQARLFSKKDYDGHDVAIVYDKLAGKFGSLGINHFEHIEPKYDNIDEVVNKLFGKKIDPDTLRNVETKKRAIKKQIQEYANANRDYSKLIAEYDALSDLVVTDISYEEADFDLSKNSGRVRPLTPARLPYLIERLPNYAHNYFRFWETEQMEEYVQKNQKSDGYQSLFGLRKYSNINSIGELLKGGERK